MAGNALKVEDATWDSEVMKAPELVMVDFWAVWCGPCQMVAPIVDELANEYAGKVKVRKLNTDENPEVAGRYQVMSIPTILFFKNGQVVEKLVGARPKRQFKEMIDQLLAQHAGSAYQVGEKGLLFTRPTPARRDAPFPGLCSRIAGHNEWMRIRTS